MFLNDELAILNQRYIASRTIANNALRNQGGPNNIDLAIEHLKTLNLNKFQVETNNDFMQVLDEQTLNLKGKFSDGAQFWGTSRKILNLFLRECLFDIVLSQKYSFVNIKKYLELPVDNKSVKYLSKITETNILRDFTTIKDLTTDVNDRIQNIAKNAAEKLNLDRIDLLLFVYN